jgi:hypothetical protein
MQALNSIKKAETLQEFAFAKHEAHLYFESPTFQVTMAQINANQHASLDLHNSGTYFPLPTEGQGSSTGGQVSSKILPPLERRNSHLPNSQLITSPNQITDSNQFYLDC